MLNTHWASMNDYMHFTYCIVKCAVDVDALRTPLAPAWCKLPVIWDVLHATAVDTLLYLDSDAFWNSTDSSIAALGSYMWPTDWVSRNVASNSSYVRSGNVFFGCNLPWAAEDRGRRRWNWTSENADRGPPNTGVMLVRRSPVTLSTLLTWWRSSVTSPRWNQRHQWEQSALWELWRTSPTFATPLRVFSDPITKECLRTMDRKRKSLVAHIPGGGHLALEQRTRHFASADLLGSARASSSWRTTLVTLGPTSSILPRTEIRQACSRLTWSPGPRGGVSLQGCPTE
jgi:hypothetical protein